jgi:hypothetical protein
MEVEMTLLRDRLPSAVEYFATAGLRLVGNGKWRTSECRLHGGSDSLRVNTESGGWVCMACGVSGGDMLGLHMALQGLDFVSAARDLGAWTDDGRPAPHKAATISPRDALTVLHGDLTLVTVIVSDVRRGVLPTEADWSAFLAAASRVIGIAEATR